MIYVQLDDIAGKKERDLTQSYDESQKKFKNELTTQQRHQKLRLHNSRGPTQDGQLEQQQLSNWCG